MGKGKQRYWKKMTKWKKGIGEKEDEEKGGDR